jgi:probable F420-dependent oxidoreductase
VAHREDASVNRTLQVGVVLPQIELGPGPEEPRAFAEAADAFGFHHLLAFDHVLGADHTGREPLGGPYTHESSFHEPLVLFGYLAACTTQIRFVTGVLVLPQRQAALVAKQAAEVDLLSHGRLTLGVGVGWNAVEYEALGASFTDRGRRCEEQIGLLRELWDQPLVDVHGAWHRVDRAGLCPRPGRRIPIWIGGFSEAAYRRAVAIGDGFLVFTNSESAVPRLHELLAERGRDRSSFGIDVLVELLPMDPGRWVAELEQAAALGADRVTLHTMGPRGSVSGLSFAEQIDAIEWYRSVALESGLVS